MHLTHKREFALGLLLTILISLSFVSIVPVHANPMGTLIDSYSETNYSSNVVMTSLHPSTSGSSSAVSQCFQTPSTTYKITSVKFYLYKEGSPVGIAYSKLYAMTGTYGSSGRPTGSVLATSDSFDVSTLTTTITLITFTFNSSQQYEMSPNTYYCIVYENPTSGTINDSNFPIAGRDTESSTHNGNISPFFNSAWDFPSDADLIFYVYGVTLIDSYSETNQSSDAVRIQTVHPSADAYASAVGQTFNATNDYKVTACKFYLKKVSTPTGNLFVAIYAHTGTYGTDGKPTGSMLIQSDRLNSSLLTTSYALYQFNFANGFWLSTGTKYCLALIGETPTILSNQYIVVGTDNTAPSHSGNCFYWSNSAWGATDTYDCCFYVYGFSREWTPIETWIGKLHGIGWRFVETWNGIFNTVQWHGIEIWTGLFTVKGFFLVERWWGKFLVSGWGIVEYWRSSHPIGNTYLQLATLLGWAGFLGVFLFFPMLAIGGKIRNSKLVLSSFIMLSVGLMLLGVFVVYKIFALI